jgi:hypothetical protein
MPFSTNTAGGTFAVTRESSTLTLPAAWCKVQSLVPLWFTGPQRNSDGELRPGVPGRLATRRELDVLEVSLNLTVAGDVLHTGTAPANTREGLEANIEHLLTFCAPVTASPFTLTATLTKPSGEQATAGVQLELLGTPNMVTSLWGRCTLVVTVPAGQFTPVA